MVLVMRLYSPVPNMCVMILVIPQYVKCSPITYLKKYLIYQIFHTTLFFFM